MVALAALSGAGLDTQAADRFCGLVGAALLPMRTQALGDSVPLSTRMARMAVALVLLGVGSGRAQGRSRRAQVSPS
jgi:hypothetical protein